MVSVAKLERLESRRLLASGTDVTSLDIGNVHYFISSDTDHGIELWTSNLDGSNAQLLKDMNPGPDNAWPQWLTAFHGKLYFSAQSNFSSPLAMGANRELWSSDGTADGTKQISDIYGGSQSSTPRDFRIVNDHLFFLANSGPVAYLHAVNEATGKVVSLSGKAASQLGQYNAPSNIIEANNLLYFEMRLDSSEQKSRWQTDGTLNGTVVSPGAMIVDGVLRVFGGDGDDQIQVSSGGGMTTISGAGASAQSFNNNDFTGITIFAIKGNDSVIVADEILTSVTINGGAGNDTIHAGGGNDVIIDSDGIDLLEGGEGNDYINNYGHTSSYLHGTVSGGAGNDTLTAGYGVDLMLGGDGNDSIVGAFGKETLDGGAGDDYIQGRGVSTQTLLGGDGNDTISGFDSDDFVDGGAGNDTLLDNQSPPPIVQQPTPPTYLITSDLPHRGTLTITGSDDPEQFLFRWKSNDHRILEILVNGIVQRTVSVFKATSIKLLSNGGNDSVDFRNVAIPTTVNGGAGDDVIYGSSAADHIAGGHGNDWINGGAGDDVMYGDAGNDKLFGGDGNDYINGGAGMDVIRSGGGRDRIIATIGLDDLRDNVGDLVTNVVE